MTERPRDRVSEDSEEEKVSDKKEIRCQFCWAVLSIENWEGEHKKWCPVLAISHKETP